MRSKFASALGGSVHSHTIGAVLALSSGSIKTGPFGTKLSAREYSISGAPVISVGEVGYGTICLSDRTKRVSPDVTDRMPEYVLAAGDIVFGRKGAVDRSAWVRPHEAGYFLGSDGIRLRFGQGVDSRFMAYQLQSSRVREWLLQHAIGTTLASLNEPTLKAVPVVLPPIDEQRAIAATLGALDEKIESNRKATALLEELGAALVESALVTDVYGFPEYDPARRLGDVLAVLETGKRPKGGVVVSNAGVVSLGAESIQSAGVVATTKFKRVPREFAATMQRGHLADGDVLVYKDGGTPGNFTPHVSAFGQGFPVSEATINEHVYRVRGIDGFSQGLLYWLLRSPWMDQEMRKRGTGVAIPGLNSTNFKDLPLPVIDRSSLDALNQQLDLMLKAMLRFGAASRRAAALRDALLPELLSGRIRVHEAVKAVL